MLSRKDKRLLTRLVLDENGSINETRVEGCGRNRYSFWIFDTLHRHHFLFQGSEEEAEEYKEAFLSFYDHVKSKKEEYELQKYRDAGIEID